MSDSMVAFAGSRLDRADHVRADPDALGRLMNGTARLLRLDELDPVIGPDGSLEWGSLAEADPDSELVFLGLNGGHGHFAEVPTALRGSVMPANGKMWGAMQALEPSELATYGGARALVGWHARHRFCAVCGSPTHLAATGTQGAPIAKGWKVHLVDGTKVTVHPFELSKQHELFGKCVMAVELYDKQSQKIETLVSTPITADGATFSFDVTEDIAKKTWDAIVWFRKV